MRILAVYHLGDLTAADAAVHLAYLARVLDADATVDQLLCAEPQGAR
jgi:hypothetical protein